MSELIVNVYLCLLQAEQWLGSAMTYTLFEYAKENADDLMADQTEETVSQVGIVSP